MVMALKEDKANEAIELICDYGIFRFTTSKKKELVVFFTAECAKRHDLTEYALT